ncbi:TIGR04540 family protein [Paenibacillus thiaminolyticus]|uniref:TIGR04540 family protein n=1 Tax=Paenibacillus thiaminolyticus TaxID=49283 RepID=UPI00232C1DEA|nr:TIGR04540 family protein [Paenibacillus thiaminolyticus]WCF07739.1 TIGR04540 family protein [Paenibacillus thiaminolyticus]
MITLELKLFYKTQREIATAINEIIDAYWNDRMSEDLLKTNIANMYINNPSKILKQAEFTTILKQQCGKRRLEVVERVLLMSGLLADQNTSEIHAGS